MSPFKGEKSMRTIYGWVRSFNSKRFLAPLGATAILATATVAWAGAPTTVYEIDGNVFDDPGNGIADWNTLNGDCSAPGGGNIRSAGGPNTPTSTPSKDPPLNFTQT